MEELGLRGWNELGVVGTIYEEEDEYSSSSIPSLEFSPSPTPQLSAGERQWSLGGKHDPDVVIHVQDSVFRLHKDALIGTSTYLKRHLNEFSEITLSPPLKITAETFSVVTDFCYGNHVAVTPFNVASLRTAAELLGMSVGRGDENLQQITEAYFRRVVAVNKECAFIVMRSCFPLLPEAETAAALVSRCIEALSLTADADADGDLSYLDDVKSVGVEDLLVILASVSQRLTDCHDLPYRIIDIYLKKNIGTVSEDAKIKMCNYIDCSILSPKHLMHAVQNPRMPLRFVVQAMFVEQLNTRHSIISAADHRTHHHQKPEKKDPTTLGAILERDAALRRVSQLKSIMNATNSRIHTLEKELNGMRKLLTESESVKHRVDSGRSASFRFSSENDNKIERGQIGSISSITFRDVNKMREKLSSSSEGSPHNVEKNFGQRLIRGLRSAFRLQKKKCGNNGNVKLEKNGDKLEGDQNGNEDIVVIKKDKAFHRRTRSQF